MVKALDESNFRARKNRKRKASSEQACRSGSSKILSISYIKNEQIHSMYQQFHLRVFSMCFLTWLFTSLYTIKKHFWEAVSAKRLMWSTLQHLLFKYLLHKEDVKGNACLSTVTQRCEATSFILLRRASFLQIHTFILGEYTENAT